jgi:UDP-N-acetyl-D-glucosamine dehydrogenase
VKIGVVGLGYVGLPLALAFTEEGHEVVGVDAEPRRVAAILRGESHIEDVLDDRLRAAGDLLHATGRYEDLADADAVLIAVPTPLTRNREPDLGPLVSAGTALAAVLRAGQLVVLESTTYPGTTRERLVPLLEESGLAAGSDFNVAYSPERVDPGRTDHTLRTTPKLVAGITPACLERAVGLYEQVCDHVVTLSDSEAAELAKLLENVFRSVNIALVNELAMLCDRWASTSGRWSKRRPPSPTASCASIRGRAWAATASRSTPSTCRGKRASTVSPPSSSSLPAR